MRTINKWLVVEGDEVRVLSRKPRKQSWDSFAFPLVIQVPTPEAQPQVTVQLPQLTEGQVMVRDLEVIAGA